MDEGLKDYYQSNLTLLKTHHPAIWEQIQDEPPEAVGKVFSSSAGKPNLIVTGYQDRSILVHSDPDPEKGSAVFTDKVPDTHQGFVAVLGMGLGYEALNILKKRPLFQKLAIFELEQGIFIQALKVMDLAGLLSDPRVILRIGTHPPVDHVLASARNTLKLEDAIILYHPASLNIALDSYKELNNEVFQHINQLNVEGTTTKVLGRQFTINRMKHISTIHHHRLMSQLKNIFQDKPAVLVAGGPSLDKNIHFLKNLQENAVIIAVDTVYPTLLNLGICPHFITTIDPSNVTFEKLAGVVSQPTNTSLICIPSANLKTAKIFPGRQVFWSFTAKHIEIWLNRILGGDIETGGASTVAHLNLISAVFLGCDPIVFVGQDLSFPGKASHAKGTVLHGSAPTPSRTDQGQQEIMTMGVDGKMVRTDRAMLSMKNHFEVLIQSTPKTYINATEGGAHIEGTEVKTLKEVIELHCKEPIHTSEFLETYYQSLNPPKSENLAVEFQKLLKIVKEVFQKIKQADNVTKALLKTVKKQKKNKQKIQAYHMLSPSQHKQIKKIDRLHAELDHTEKIWHFVEEITLEGLKESERRKLGIASLEKDPKRYLDWLIKNLERLMGINEARRETVGLLAENLEMVLNFRETEKRYSQDEETRLDLARLYVETENYYLAKPLLKTLCDLMPDSGEVHFLTGCTALQFNEPERAQDHFNRAVSLDDSFGSRIQAFRQELGDEFFSYAQHFKKMPNRDASTKYTLKKGLRLCPFHPELKKELEVMLSKELTQIHTWIDNGQAADAVPLLEEWVDLIHSDADVAQSLPEDLTAKVFSGHGKLHLSKKDYAKALQNFEKALELNPEDNDLYFLMIDACFVSGDFNKGIETLNRAVRVDTKFAGYWETIGDQLREGEQYKDSIAAYERCISYLPERINLIRKIGDCYLALGLLDEAKAAYEMMKDALNKKDSE